jgi:hypothetical protein
MLTRYRPRFSLRILLVVVAFAGLASWYFSRVCRQIAFVQQARPGAHALVYSCDPDQEFRHCFGGNTQTWPWPARLFGPDCFYDVTVLERSCNETPLPTGLLTCFQKLKKLALAGDKLASADVAAIGGLKQLDYLLLASPNIDDAGLAGLESCRALRTVVLDAPITDRTLERLWSASKLDELTLRNCRVAGDAFQTINADNALTGLKIADTPLRAAFCESLGRCRNLSWLELSNTHLPEDAWAKLGDLPKLRCLMLDREQFGQAGFERVFSTAPNLKTLWLAHCLHAEAGLRMLPEPSKLSYIQVYDVSIDESAIDIILARCPHLHWLEVEVKIADIGAFLKRLRPHSKLRHLDLGASSIGPEYRELLREKLPNLEW